MAILNIERPWGYFGFARSLKIWIDGKHVGSVASQAMATFELPAGQHRIQVSMDWCKSVPVDLLLEEKAPCHCRVTTPLFLLATLYCFFRPSRVFVVQQQ
ncbi:hypothetical protein HPT27_02210 [Permianibacter sp. IMCC34836]|uniref:hypothetical protein n=1 Tax=Permianibacter fluminis TaxID=2738515 RepID=UPI0015516F3E|nr:hypothetical protein [Permianibacter fluminis]NQD35817.1 hypothetical protein [Permianibacter fluminis]